MIRRPDLRNSNPWVKVDKQTYQILFTGTFDIINELKVEGHTMTLSLYNQITEERHNQETIEKIHSENLEILPN
jgi:hypothetical protein